jgi:hypothetical protein
VVGAVYEQVFFVRRGDHGGWNVPFASQFENNQPPGYIRPVIKYRSHGDDNRVVLPRAMDGVVRIGDTATFRTLVDHGFLLGEKVIVTGVEDASFNGDMIVTNIPSSTSFVAHQVGPDARSGGGLVSTVWYKTTVVTGGAFYEATQFPPDYRGNFFCTDYASGRIMRATLDAATNAVTSVSDWATDIAEVVDMAVGPDGAMYYVGHSSGLVFRTSYNSGAPGLVVTPTNVWIVEGHASPLDVRLASAPDSDVTVSVARSAGDASVSVFSGATLVFTSANWDHPQTAVIVAAEDEDPNDGLATVSIGTSGLTSESVTVHVRDTDAPKLQLSASVVAIDEGKSATFTVALVEQPPAEVVVYVALTKGGLDVTLSSAASLTFTNANWSVPQPVTVVAAEDQDTADDLVTISLTPANRTETNVQISVRDNDGVPPPPNACMDPVSAGTTSTPEGIEVEVDAALGADACLVAPDAGADGGGVLDRADAAPRDSASAPKLGAGGCTCQLGGSGGSRGGSGLLLLLIVVLRGMRRTAGAGRGGRTS